MISEAWFYLNRHLAIDRRLFMTASCCLSSLFTQLWHCSSANEDLQYDQGSGLWIRDFFDTNEYVKQSEAHHHYEWRCAIWVRQILPGRGGGGSGIFTDKDRRSILGGFEFPKSVSFGYSSQLLYLFGLLDNKRKLRSKNNFSWNERAWKMTSMRQMVLEISHLKVRNLSKMDVVTARRWKDESAISHESFVGLV